MPLIVRKDRTAEVFKAVRELTRKQVLVGVPAEGSDRKPEPGEPNPPNNALIGYVMEFGAPEKNIPARPHLVPGVEKAMPKITERLKATGQKALSGDTKDIDKGLHAVGLIAQNEVSAKITDGPFVPLAPRTLQQRKARGRTGETPLIDTGQYRRAQTYVIRERGK